MYYCAIESCPLYIQQVRVHYTYCKCERAAMYAVKRRCLGRCKVNTSDYVYATVVRIRSTKQVNTLLGDRKNRGVILFEIRQSKRSYEQKLAWNIKNDSKSFYAYVRSKQNVQDKVGPLEDSAGNIISQGFLMAEDLNVTSVQCLPKKILVHYQLLVLNFRGLNLTI